MASTIQILLFGDLGDAVLTIPAIRAVRESFPSARIQLLCKAEIGKIVAGLDVIDEVVAVDKAAYDSPAATFKPGNLWSLARLALRLRSARPETVIVFHHLVRRWGTMKYAALALAGGAKRRVGLDNGRGWFLTERVPDLGFGAYHESEYWMQVAAAAGATGRPALEFPVSDADRHAVDHLLAYEGLAQRKLVAIHPGTGAYGPGRRWHAESFAAAAALVARECDVHFVVVGTELERDAATTIEQRLEDRATNLTGRTTVNELAALLERCRLTIANDGGVAHVSAAVNTPVVAIFGPSNEAAWRPLLGEVVASELPCRPCFYHDFKTGKRFGCASRECLALVTPRDVAQAAVRLLGPGRAA